MIVALLEINNEWISVNSATQARGHQASRLVIVDKNLSTKDRRTLQRTLTTLGGKAFDLEDLLSQKERQQ